MWDQRCFFSFLCSYLNSILNIEYVLNIYTYVSIKYNIYFICKTSTNKEYPTNLRFFSTKNKFRSKTAINCNLDIFSLFYNLLHFGLFLALTYSYTLLLQFQYGQRVPTAASPSNTNSSSSSNTGSQSGTLSTSLSNTNTNTTMGPSNGTQQQGEQLSKTNLYIRGLQQGTTDKDLVSMCAQ